MLRDDHGFTVATVVQLALDEGAGELVLSSSIAGHPEAVAVAGVEVIVERVSGIRHGELGIAEYRVIGPQSCANEQHATGRHGVALKDMNVAIPRCLGPALSKVAFAVPSIGLMVVGDIDHGLGVKAMFGDPAHAVDHSRHEVASDYHHIMLWRRIGQLVGMPGVHIQVQIGEGPQAHRQAVTQAAGQRQIGPGAYSAGVINLAAKVRFG